MAGFLLSLLVPAAVALSAAPARDSVTYLVRMREAAGIQGEAPPTLVPPVAAGLRRAARAARVRAHLAAAQREITRILPVLSALRAEGAIARFETVPAAGVAIFEGSAAAAATLAADPAVAAVMANRERRLADLAPAGAAIASRPLGWNLAAVGADRAWRELGATGEGVVIATIDSGAQWTHPALLGRYRGRLGDHRYHWFDATASPARAPVDPHGHGTQVLGVAVGRAGSLAYGVAPGADWIAVRAFDAQGRATDAALLRAGAWLLAPTDLDGRNPRPDLAPDIVNGSWALDNGADPLYNGLLAAWRAAGILPVFAAGNLEVADCPAGCDDEQTAGRIRAPAASPLAVAVGASVPGGEPWSRSAAGPAFSAALKPDLVAPGSGIMAPLASGGEAPTDGTSMAAPHVSGAAAVVLSVAPGLTVDDLESFLRHAARDRGVPGADPRYGWGNLDVFAAAAGALTAGRLSGILLDAAGEPVSGAVVQATTPGGPLPWETTTGTDGRWSLAVPAGRWTVEARAFDGLAPARTVHVTAGLATRVDLELQALPSGWVIGRISSVRGGALRSASVVAVGGEATHAAAGAYTMELPAGRHVLRFAAAGHRALTTTVHVDAGTSLTQNVELWPAPRILLVDADAGAGPRVHPYAARALADVGYEPSVAVLEASAGAAGGLQLGRYDVVLWLHGADGSPGRLDAHGGGEGLRRALTDYLAKGGRLVLAGQDVGRWDAAEGSREARLAPDFFRHVLGARWLADSPLSSRVMGVGPLEGLDLSLRWPLGSGTGASWAPDVVAPFGAARPILSYPDGRAAGVTAADDEWGRRVYLAFGLQQAGGRVAAARLMDRLLAWLESPSIALDADPQPLAPAAVSRVAVGLSGGRTDLPLTVLIHLPAGLEAVDLPPGMIDTGEGELRWSGPLAAESRRWLPFWVRWAGPVAGGSPLPLGAVAITHRRVLTATAQVWPLAPDLEDSTLTVVPPRLPAPGPVTATLVLRNDGLAAAPGASLSLTLPVALLPGAASASAGHVTPVPGGYLWSGDVAPGTAVTITATGLLGAGEAPARFTARILDDIGWATERGATALVGGPDLGASRLLGPDQPPVVGQTFRMTLRLENTGAGQAVAHGRLHLPPHLILIGDDATPSDAGTIVGPWLLPPGTRREVRFGLRSGDGAPPGSWPVTLRLDDGAAPTVPVDLGAEVSLRRADLQVSRAVLLPATTRSGEVVTATLLVGNTGDAAADIAVTDALPPSLSLDPASVAVSDGRGVPGTAAVTWRTTAPAAMGAYTWTAVAGGESTLGGRSVPPGEPLDLGLPFPFHTQVFTRAWATTDGLLLLQPPAAVAEGVGLSGSAATLPPLSVAPYWRKRAARAPWPILHREADRVSVTWPAAQPGGEFTVTLLADGQIHFNYGPHLAPADGLAGLGGDGVGMVGGEAGARGRGLVLPAAAVVPGGRVAISPPVAWRWLRFTALVAAGLSPNSTLQHTAFLEDHASRHIFAGEALANRLSLGRSTLQVLPAGPASGTRLRARLRLEADGQAEARGVEARVDLPTAARLDDASLAPGLVPAADAETLGWRGRLAPGQPVDLEWTMHVDPDLPPGARITLQAEVQAPGVATVRLLASTAVRATDFSGSGKLVDRAVAWPGQVLRFTLRVANASPAARTVTMQDALPPGLSLLPASLTASSGALPRWDEGSRSLRWSGLVPASSVVEIGFQARFRGEPLTNVMHLDDGAGTVAAFWADVAAARHRLMLPLLGGGWPQPSGRP